jgi:hypothetical protein
MQAVLAVSHASIPEQVLSTNVAGFILVGARLYGMQGCRAVRFTKAVEPTICNMCNARSVPCSTQRGSHVHDILRQSTSAAQPQSFVQRASPVFTCIAVLGDRTADLITILMLPCMQIKEVDMTRGTVTYLAPCPGPLPGRYLLVGSLRSAMD